MAEHRWICVREHLPTMKLMKSLEEGGRDYLESDFMLVWDGHKTDIAQAISDESGVYWLDRCSDVVKAVFWMPLPTPPEQCKEDEN